MHEAVRPSQYEIDRRKQLIDMSKSQDLTMVEVKEVQAILSKELRYDLDAGKVGFLAFVLLQHFINFLPSLLPHGGING